MNRKIFASFVTALQMVQTLAIIYALTVGTLWYFKGRQWFKQTILPFHELVFYCLLIATVFVVVPLLVVKTIRPYSRQLLHQLPYFFGGIAWFYAANYCLNSLGKFWFIFGSCIVGFGVVPIAVAGAVIKGNWAFFWFLCLQLSVTFGCRYIAASVPSSPLSRPDSAE